MKRRLLVPLFLLFSGACGASAQPFGNREKAVHGQNMPAESEVTKDALDSESLGVKKRFRVYLPVGYKNSTERFPVIYLLHGLGGNEDSWVKMGLPKAADEAQLAAIVVMPDGDDGFYADWEKTEDFESCLKGKAPFEPGADMQSYCVKNRKYESYITRDLIRYVDEKYRTHPERDSRAIAGVSMGGFGALYLAFKHPALFSAVASHSGVAAFLYEGPYPYKKGKAKVSRNPKKQLKAFGPGFGPHIERILGTDIKRWRAHDPVALATQLDRQTPLAIYLDCGTDDEFRLQNGNSYLSEVLTAAGVEHELHLEPGKHDVPFFESRIDDSIRFLAGAFTR